MRDAVILKHFTHLISNCVHTTVYANFLTGFFSALVYLKYNTLGFFDLADPRQSSGLDTFNVQCGEIYPPSVSNNLPCIHSPYMAMAYSISAP